MRNNQNLCFFILVIGISLYNIMLLFEFSESVMGWVVSDLMLLLYLAYLLDTFVRGSIKAKVQ